MAKAMQGGSTPGRDPHQEWLFQKRMAISVHRDSPDGGSPHFQRTGEPINEIDEAIATEERLVELICRTPATSVKGVRTQLETIMIELADQGLGDTNWAALNNMLATLRMLELKGIQYVDYTSIPAAEILTRPRGLTTPGCYVMLLDGAVSFAGWLEPLTKSGKPRKAHTIGSMRFTPEQLGKPARGWAGPFVDVVRIDEWSPPVNDEEAEARA